MPSQTVAPPQQSQAAAPGSRFSIPPFTDEIEQPDNNDLITATPSATSQVPYNGIIPFMQSDVIYGWMMEVYPNHVQTDGATPNFIEVSPYSPHVHLGPLLLNMQYQYPSISVASGQDLAMVSAYRPLVPAKRGIGNFNALVSYGSTGGSQPSQLFTNITHNTGVAQTPFFQMELPASVWFDSYYELDETGMPVSGPHQGFVSPQNMGGYARVVTPSIRLNPYQGVGALGLADQSVYEFSPTTTSTISGQSTILGFSRIGVLGSLDQSVLPQPTNWQYNIAHQQIALTGLSKVSVPMNGIFAGQIMSISARMFDPTVVVGGQAVGGPIPVANVTNFVLQYGGSVQRFNGGVTSAGTPVTSVRRLQRRFAEQHLFIPAEGWLVLDLAFDRNLGITNSYCLNTLRTAAVQLNVVFSAAQNSGAYMEVTVEGLRWVPLPVNPSQ